MVAMPKSENKAFQIRRDLHLLSFWGTVAFPKHITASSPVETKKKLQWTASIIMADKGHTLYMKVALALYVARIVQLHTLHVNLARFTCCHCVCGSDNCFVCLLVYAILIQLFFKINFIDQENHHNLCLPVGLSVGRSVFVCPALCLPISN